MKPFRQQRFLPTVLGVLLGYFVIVLFMQAQAHDEQPTNAEVKAQLDRIEQQARHEAMKARQRAFMEAAQRDAQRHQARGMCAVNGTC